MPKTVLEKALTIIEPMRGESYFGHAVSRIVLSDEPVKAARAMMDDYRAVVVMRESLKETV